MILHRMTALIGVIGSKEKCAFTIGVSNLTPYLGQEATLAGLVCNLQFSY